MIKWMKDFFDSENITHFSLLPIDKCIIIRPDLLHRHGFNGNEVTAVFFLVPYLSPSTTKSNVSAYCRAQDYHLYMKELEDRAVNSFSSHGFCSNIKIFSDHSPFNEVRSAAAAGLGMIGYNNLLICPEYSSFVFIGTLVIDSKIPTNEEFIDKTSFCEGCQKCTDACPTGAISCTHAPEMDLCISYITQKKGQLSDIEKNSITKAKTVWGCDICQNVCPHTVKAIEDQSIYTPIDFFQNNLINIINSNIINNMNECNFKKRAYSWRGKQPILRNISLFEDDKIGSE